MDTNSRGLTSTYSGRNNPSMRTRFLSSNSEHDQGPSSKSKAKKGRHNPLVQTTYHSDNSEHGQAISNRVQRYNHDQKPDNLKNPPRSRFFLNLSSEHTNTSTSDDQDYGNEESRESSTYICPSCKFYYGYQRTSDNFTGRVPRTLSCGHTICEMCLKKKDKIQCPVCGNESSKGDYNLFAMGELLCSATKSHNIISFAPVGGRMDVKRPPLPSVKQISFDFNDCPVHNKPEMLFCQGCNVICCTFCLIDNHQSTGHYAICLAVLKNEEKDEFDKLLNDAKAELSRRSNKENNAKYTSKKNQHLNKLETEISQYFLDLHARLCGIERRLLAEARTTGESTAETKTQHLRKLIESYDNRGTKDTNMHSLLKELKETLATLPSSKEPSENLEFVVDESISKLDDHFKLELRPDTRTFFEKPVVKAPKATPPAPPRRSKRVFDGFFKIKLTYVVSLEEFYVQLVAQQDELSNLKVLINSCADLDADGCVWERNDMCLALHGAEQWSRARIVDVDRDGDRFRVQYIDYGDEADVAGAALRPISDALRAFKPFAQQCRLHNPSSKTWPEGAHAQLNSILGADNEICMSIVDGSNAVYAVDLYITTTAEQSSSLAELLICGMGILHKDSTSQLIDNPTRFKKGDTQAVSVKHVAGVDRIYVHLRSYCKTAVSLSNLLSERYFHSKCDIQLPIANTDVVVHQPITQLGDWHRARILKVSTIEKTVDVFLVDCGITERVDWSKLRRLKAEFCRSFCLAIEAKLADVKVVDGGSRKVVEFLKRYEHLSDSQMKMLIVDTEPLAVALFLVEEGRDTNINTLLVQEGLTESSGKLSETLSWPRQELEPQSSSDQFLPVPEDDDDDDDDDIFNFNDGFMELLHVEVLNFEGPHTIHVRNIDGLQKFYEGSKPDHLAAWRVEETVVVHEQYINFYSVANILRQSSHNKYLVRKSGTTQTKEVPRQALRKLDGRFSDYQCYMANVKPAGDSTKWSRTAIECCQRAIRRYSHHIYVAKLSPTKEPVPVSLWYSKVIPAESPVEPPTVKYFSIDARIVKYGLALRLKPFEHLETPELAVKPKSKSNSPVTPTSMPELRQRKASPPQTPRYWIPALPFVEKEFTACITTVEAGGHLFVRDDRFKRSYEEMEQAITAKMNIEPKQQFTPTPNQMVMVTENDKWYRASVLNVIDQNHTRILMVDYGSDHTVHNDHLHPTLLFTDTPIVVNKIKLDDLLPKCGRWLESDTEILETTKADCKVVLMSDPNDYVPLANVYFENGDCLNDILALLSRNLYRKCSKVTAVPTWNDAADDETKTKLSYTKTALPTYRPAGKTLAEIASVFDIHRLSIRVAEDATQTNSFHEMMKQIQDEIGTCLLLDNWKPETPCLSLYDVDGLWYRAQIFEKTANKDMVYVYYVDYGNFELVDKTNVRKIRDDWLDLPVNFRIAKLHYVLIDQEQKDDLLKYLRKLEGTHQCVAYLKEEPLYVHIYNIDNLQTVVYNNFVKSGAIKLYS